MSPLPPSSSKPAALPLASNPPPRTLPTPVAPLPETPAAAPVAVKPARNPFLVPLLLAALIIFGGVIYFFGIAPRLAEKGQVDQEQKLSTERTVIYAVARLASPKTELSLPGTIQAFQQASIYARTSGYVKRWLVDIGQLVHQGDLLAELDTPEVDQQLGESRATVEKDKASLEIAQSTAERWNGMLAAHAVSQQEAAEKNATRDEAKATLDADLATVGRLTDEENFKEIRAPFTGTITHRDIEVGNLVSAGNGTGTRELYRIAQTDPLRVYLSVPEANTPSIHPGLKAYLHVSAWPDRIFEGDVVRSAGAVDEASHTLQTEVDVVNHDATLLPGTFAEVRLDLSDPGATILIPANTLIVNSSGTQVARLDDLHDATRPDHFKVSLLPVKVGRDFGTEIEVLEPLDDGDRLIANPPADLTDGIIVTAKALPKTVAPVPPGGGAITPPKS